MDHESEAACLLRTGNQYPDRLGFKQPGGELVFAGLKPGGFCLYIEDDPYYHFDLDGRWQRVYEGGVHYRKALDGRIDALDRVREREGLRLKRRTLAADEASALDERVREAAARLARSLVSGATIHLSPPPGHRSLRPETLSVLLGRVIALDGAAWSDLDARFQAIYRPWGFLPPDDLQAIVLQVDEREGLSKGSIDGFRQHCAAVAALVGRRRAQTRSLLLQGPGLRGLTAEHRQGLGRVLREVFALGCDPVAPRNEHDGVSRLEAVDLDLGVMREPWPWPAEAWAHLRQYALGRVTLTLVSGDVAIAAEHGVVASPQAITELIARCAEAGGRCSLIIPLGIAGADQSEAHVNATARLLEGCRLSSGDHLYLVDAGDLGPAGLVAPRCDESALEAERLRFKAALSQLCRRTGAKLIRYNPNKQ